MATTKSPSIYTVERINGTRNISFQIFENN